MDGQVTVLPDNQNHHFDDGSVMYYNSQMLRTMADIYKKAISSGTKRIEDFYKELERMRVADARSLLYTYNIITNKSWENIRYDDDDYKNLLIKALQNCTYPIDRFNELLHAKAAYILPEAYLDWFKNDLRCSLFLMSLIVQLFSNNAYKGRGELINGISNCLRYDIAIFNSNFNKSIKYENIITIAGDSRISYIESIKSTYLKGCTEDKEIKWLNAKNNEQIEWAYSYLDNDPNKRILLQGIFFPETIDEKYELILAHLDSLTNIKSIDIGTKKNKGFSERGYVLYSMKKAWDGRKNYESKSDSSIKIYKKNQEKLEALAERNKTTVIRLINQYIEDSYKNSFIDHENSAKIFDQNAYAENVNKDQYENRTLEPNLELESISSELVSNDNVTKPSSKSKEIDRHKIHSNLYKREHKRSLQQMIRVKSNDKYN